MRKTQPEKKCFSAAFQQAFRQTFRQASGGLCQSLIPRGPHYIRDVLLLYWWARWVITLSFWLPPLLQHLSERTKTAPLYGGLPVLILRRASACTRWAAVGRPPVLKGSILGLLSRLLSGCSTGCVTGSTTDSDHGISPREHQIVHNEAVAEPKQLHRYANRCPAVADNALAAVRIFMKPHHWADIDCAAGFPIDAGVITIMPEGAANCRERGKRGYKTGARIGDLLDLEFSIPTRHECKSDQQFTQIPLAAFSPMHLLRKQTPG